MATPCYMPMLQTLVKYYSYVINNKRFIKVKARMICTVYRDCPCTPKSSNLQICAYSGPLGPN
jgi:hypothetical protein